MKQMRHVHRTWDGEYERDEWGQLRFCHDETCIEWASSNQRVINTVGAAIFGGLVGALIGSLVRQPGAGALAGAALGALTVQGVHEGSWDGPTHEGVPALPPRPTVF